MVEEVLFFSCDLQAIIVVKIKKVKNITVLFLNMIIEDKKNAG